MNNELKLVVERFENRHSPEQIDGVGTVVYNGIPIAVFSTIELPWKHNQKNKSAIPAGTYRIEREIHGKFKKCYRLKGVAGREGILIHVGNNVKETRGCILVGQSLDWESRELRESRKTIDKLYKYDIKKLEIINHKFNYQ